MPAKSRVQQRYMGMVHAIQKGELDPDEVSPEMRKTARTIKKKSAKDFASTKHKGLPTRVTEAATAEDFIDTKISLFMTDIDKQVVQFGGVMTDYVRNNQDILTKSAVKRLRANLKAMKTIQKAARGMLL